MNHQLRKSLKIMAFQRWCQEPPAEVAAKAEISARWQACNSGSVAFSCDCYQCGVRRSTVSPRAMYRNSKSIAGRRIGAALANVLIATALNVVCPGTWGLRCL